MNKGPKFETRVETRAEEEEGKFGVLGYKIEDNHYIVDIRWKDGQVNQHRFPEKGFPVIDPVTHEKHSPISGKRALEILQEYAGTMNSDEFSWLDFVGLETKKKKK